MPSKIFVKGARENNLKNIDVEIPRDALTVITGLSGSGKSSLAFDTIYAEGQRRYVESLSSYARMFLGQKEKPDVDYIEGLSPAISIDQKTTSQNPRSTVGTVTEVYDYLRLLWARVGTPHCPNCGKEIRQQSIDQIIDQLMALGEGTRVQIMAPVIRGKKGEHVKIFEDARRSGYVRVRADGNMYDLSEEISLEKNKKHNIEVVVDRLILRPDVVHRLTDSCETAAALSGGLILANILPDDRDILFSQNYACEDCGISIEELTPRMFSFNNPFGACPTCTGLGTQLKVDPELVIPNKSVSLLDGAICASGWNNVRGDGISRMYFEALSKKYHFSLRDPVEKLSKEVMDVILYGTKGEKLELQYDQPRGKGVLYQAFEGIIPNLERRYKETQSDGVREELESCMSECPCPTCGGKRLRRESLAVTVGNLSISDYCEKSVVDALDFVDKLTLTEQQMRIGERILKEIKNRLGFLRSVGLEYLTLSRASATLSGGEAQRIRLATQIGSSLMGVLYILDEPTTGLHFEDIRLLLEVLILAHGQIGTLAGGRRGESGDLNGVSGRIGTGEQPAVTADEPPLAVGAVLHRRGNGIFIHRDVQRVGQFAPDGHVIHIGKLFRIHNELHHAPACVTTKAVVELLVRHHGKRRRLFAVERAAAPKPFALWLKQSILGGDSGKVAFAEQLA